MLNYQIIHKLSFILYKEESNRYYFVKNIFDRCYEYIYNTYYISLYDSLFSFDGRYWFIIEKYISNIWYDTFVRFVKFRYLHKTKFRNKRIYYDTYFICG